MQTTEVPQPTTLESPVPRWRRASRVDRFCALFVLTAFGITWPVLELLGDNAEFFLARRSPKGEIVATALLATIVIPAIVGLIGSLPGRIGAWVGSALIMITASSLVRLYLARTGMPDWVDVALALAAGAGITWAFYRYAGVRQGARYLVVAPLVLLAMFLFAMPVGAVLREPDQTVGNPVPVANPTPVVMLVFDEFPLASIIDSDGSLRSDRFPNFARLAADGTWYRNAVTVEQQTEHSVPALLTGSVPDQTQTPVAGQYPFNLFTALRSTYDLHVYEAITQLCPRQLCEGLTSSASSLVADVGVVSGHLLLPGPLTTDLPPIDRGWGDFAAAAGEFDAREAFQDLLEDGVRSPIDRVLEDIRSYDPSEMPLFYMHAIVPHHPWQYLPDGRHYPFIVDSNPASVDGGWNGDEFLVAQSMQRHLLQVGYADHVVGEVVAELEAAGLYESSLLIVVADHGIAIRPGVDHQRRITDESVGEIAAIPLFVKTPNAEGGVIDDRRALTIDVLPTIADVIDARLPDGVEGVSLLGPPVEREQTTTVGPDGAVTYGADGHEKLEVAARIESWFPDGNPYALRPPGSPDLIGQTLDTSTLPVSGLSAEIMEADLYADVDLSSEVVPARIGASLHEQVDEPVVVAVVVNGKVGALTRTFRDDEGASLLSLVDPALFVDGSNRIELVEVTGSGELARIATP